MTTCSKHTVVVLAEQDLQAELLTCIWHMKRCNSVPISQHVPAELTNYFRSMATPGIEVLNSLQVRM